LDIESREEVFDHRPVMGEVHIKAQLTNAIDEALFRRGALTADRVRSCEFDAFVDTGASRRRSPSVSVWPSAAS
jgi:hypothetical protein